MKQRDVRPFIMLLVALFVGALVFGSVLRARAQSTTPEPTQILSTTALDPTYLESGKIAVDVVSLVGIIVAAFVTGGVTISAGLGVLAGKLLKNKDALDAMERIAINTVPTHLLVEGNKIIVDAQQWFDLLNKITDNKPNDVALVASLPEHFQQQE